MSVCTVCGFENPPGFRFCGRCGATLDASNAESTTPNASLVHTIAPEPERRQITVMFCDLVGSTALSEQLDPEDLRLILRDYQTVAAKVVNRYDGQIAKYLGDGLLVQFGYPRAHEDDAQRAVRAALGILEGVSRLAVRDGQLFGVDLAVRIGIHTGVVVVGEIGGEGEHIVDIVGETPNVAARLQSLAEPNTIIVSSTTFRLVEGFFHSHDRGFHNVKGISHPIAIYQIDHESGARSRLEAAGDLTPLVGRDREQSIMGHSWEQAALGDGQVLLLGGEPGIGKSRLVQWMKEQAAHNPKAWITECRCSPYYANTPFYPVIELLERVVLRLAPTDTSGQRLDKIEGFLVQYGMSLEESVPLLAGLLSIPLDDRYAPLADSPQRQKQRTIQMLLSILFQRAAEQPLLMVWEDLQWVDPSSLEIITLMIDQIPNRRLYALLTYRPEFTPPWEERPHIDSIMLERLPQEQIVAMITEVTEGKKLPQDVVQQIITKADGVPLFIEELTQTVLDSGSLQESGEGYELYSLTPDIAIPATLRDSLTARLDRMAPVKSIAQIGAAIGREFSYDMIHRVTMLDERTLKHGLGQLVDAGMLHESGAPPDAVYTFKHILLQEAAYESLLKSSRQQFHHMIAQILVDHYASVAETKPELLAYHYFEAGLGVEAITSWRNAGRRALQRSANLEAISHFTRALDVLASLPESAERDQLELSIRVGIGTPLMATRGYAAPDVKQTYVRAEELCRTTGDASQRFMVLRGLAVYYFTLAEFQSAYDLSLECIELAEGDQQSGRVLEACRIAAATLFWMGRFDDAQPYVDRAMRIYDPKEHASHAITYGQDASVLVLSYFAWTQWFRGESEQAIESIDRAIAHAREIGHPQTLVLTLSFAMMLHRCIGNVDRVRAVSDEVVEVSAKYGLALWQAVGQILQGWVIAAEGDVETGLAKMRTSLDAWRATGAGLLCPYFLSILVEAGTGNRAVEDDLAVIDEALAMARDHGEGFWESELFRQRGVALMRLGSDHAAESEDALRTAVDIARRQHAKGVELRALMSLFEFLKDSDKSDEGREMLAESYNQFTEGFETNDLVRAQRLLSISMAESAPTLGMPGEEADEQR